MSKCSLELDFRAFCSELPCIHIGAINFAGNFALFPIPLPDNPEIRLDEVTKRRGSALEED